MGEIRASNGVQYFRILFVISNIVFLILGLTVLGIGIWLVVEGNNYGEALTGDGYVAGGALLIVCGIISFIVTIIGIIGAITLRRPLLVIYILLVILICILEFAAGIFGFIYREEISDEIDERMRDAIADYRSPDTNDDAKLKDEVEFNKDAIANYRFPDSPDYQEDVNYVGEFVQNKFDCCGADNYTDWINLNPDIVCTVGGFPECGCDLREEGCIDIYVALNCTDPLAPGFTPFLLTVTASVWDTGCIDEMRDEQMNIPGTNGFQEDVNDAVEFVQDRFDCCGAENYTDWINLNPDIVCTHGGFPECGCDLGEEGCIDISVVLNCTDPLAPGFPPFLRTVNTSVWDTGCTNEVRDALEAATYVLGGISIAFGVFEVLIIIVALGLCFSITKLKKQPRDDTMQLDSK